MTPAASGHATNRSAPNLSWRAMPLMFAQDVVDLDLPPQANQHGARHA
jgi:hypothetical protein